MEKTQKEVTKDKKDVVKQDRTERKKTEKDKEVCCKTGKLTAERKEYLFWKIEMDAFLKS